MALEALVTLRSRSQERVVPLERFYKGVRKTVMQPDEMMVDISFPALETQSQAVFIKLALRQAQAISLVNVAVVLTLSEPMASSNGNVSVEKASITLGAVAPVIIHAKEAEEYVTGRQLDEETIDKTAKMAESEATPIDDVRSSADYRREMVRVCTLRALREIASGEVSRNVPDNPVLLWGNNGNGKITTFQQSGPSSTIQTRINGREYTFEDSFHRVCWICCVRTQV